MAGNQTRARVLSRDSFHLHRRLDGRNGKEVHRGDGLSMVSEKASQRPAHSASLGARFIEPRLVPSEMSKLSHEQPAVLARWDSHDLSTLAGTERR